MDLVLNTVKASHQHSCEAQVWVGDWVGETSLNTLTFRACNVWDTDRSRAVTGRVSQHNRGFKTRNQTLVRVGAWVRESIDGFSVLDHTANVVQGSFRQTRIAVTSELVFAVFPVRHVNMHTRTVITHNRLRHEGRSFAVGVSNVVYAVLKNLNFISFLNHGVEFNTDFTLTSGSNFVVVNFYVQTHLLHGVTHSSTDVVQAVYWWYWEVAAFNARAVTHVAVGEGFASGPIRFFRVDLNERARHVLAPLDVVKNEELRLWTEESCVAQTGRLQVLFSALSNRAGIALVALHGRRLNDVAAQDNGRFVGEWVEDRGAIVWHQNHV